VQFFAYAGKSHPEYAAEQEIVFTYSILTASLTRKRSQIRKARIEQVASEKKSEQGMKKQIEKTKKIFFAFFFFFFFRFSLVL
jgi:hypothetical protein